MLARGMLDLSPPVARCTRCAWEGVPTFQLGHVRTECPSCEGAADEDDLWLELLELTVRRGWRFRIRVVSSRRREKQARRAERNRERKRKRKR